MHNHEEEESNLCSSFRTGCSALALLGVAAPDAAAEAAAAVSRSRTAYTFRSRQVAKIDINAAPTHASIVILRLDT